MNYQEHYNLLIKKSKSENRKKYPKSDNRYIYYEKHHIIPNCFYINNRQKNNKGWINGNPGDKSNLVYLTAREHFIAHLLLAKIYGGRLWHAAHMMSNMKKYTSRKYKFIKEKHAEELSISQNGRKAPKGEESPSYGLKRSDEFKNNVSARRKGKPAVKQHTEETKQKMRESRNKQTKTSQKEIIVFGYKYSSLKEACDTLNRNHKYIISRLRSDKFPDCYYL
jgi:hypothetical protein